MNRKKIVTFRAWLGCLAFLHIFAISLTAAEQKKLDEYQQRRVNQSLRLFEAWADASLAYEHIPGMSAGFVNDQDLIWSRGFGFADMERRTSATPETLYGICSISKLFTAVAVLQQRDAGKLHLDDPVTRHLPYANLPAASKDSPTANIASLLTHSSGLPRESAHPYWTDPQFAFPSKEEVVAGLRSQQMLYPAERYFQYSNLGLTFAGEVVEKITGKSYEEYVQAHILQPLDLTNTTPYLPEDQKGKALATGYGALTREGKRDEMPFYQTRGIAPAAGFASNVKDLAKFASWQFRLLENGGEEVLKASTLREMQRVHWVDPDWETTWGLGFGVRRDKDDTLVGHSGACPGYFTSLLLNPKKKIAAIVLMNAMNVNTWHYASQLAKIVGPALEEESKGDEKRTLSDADQERFSGVYWSAWGESIVVPWKDGLAAVDVPTRDPMGDLTELQYVEGNRFRRVRKDSDDLGEDVVFESANDGKIIRMLWHQNYSRKVR